MTIIDEFSPNCQMALENFRCVVLSNCRDIYQHWQKWHPNQSWSMNNLWDLCYACCVTRMVNPEEAARAAEYANSQNFWLAEHGLTI